MTYIYDKTVSADPRVNALTNKREVIFTLNLPLIYIITAVDHIYQHDNL